MLGVNRFFSLLLPLLSYSFIFGTTPLSGYDFAILQEEEFYACSDELAALHIDVFREYPYLYDGSLEVEKRYLAQYLSTKNRLIIVAKDGERVIGALTGIPLNESFGDCRSFFVERNIPMDSIFYVGEMTVDKEYRKKWIGARMYELFEQFVRENTTYHQIGFFAVVSPEDDPRRTSDYFCLDEIYVRKGFVQQPGMVAQFSWKEIGNENESCHPMIFWIKKL